MFLIGNILWLKAAAFSQVKTPFLLQNKNIVDTNIIDSVQKNLSVTIKNISEYS